MTATTDDHPSTEESPLSAFQALFGGPSVKDWQDTVLQAVVRVWEDHPATESAKARYAGGLALVPDLPVRFGLDDLAENMTMNALEIGALMGYALAKSWPTELERLDGWIEAAKAYARLDDYVRDWEAEDDLDQSA